MLDSWYKSRKGTRDTEMEIWDKKSVCLDRLVDALEKLERELRSVEISSREDMLRILNLALVAKNGFPPIRILLDYCGASDYFRTHLVAVPRTFILGTPGRNVKVCISRVHLGLVGGNGTVKRKPRVRLRWGMGS